MSDTSGYWINLHNVIGRYLADNTNVICKTQWVLSKLAIFKCSHGFTCYLTDIGKINDELRINHQEYMELKEQYVSKDS